MDDARSSISLGSCEAALGHCCRILYVPGWLTTVRTNLKESIHEQSTLRLKEKASKAFHILHLSAWKGEVLLFL